MSRVYSTDQGRICPDCNQPATECICKRQAARPAGDGVVRISRETKGRKGKGVTLVAGLPLAGEDLKTLAKQLRQQLSTGGSIKDGVVEFQGDQRMAIKSLLEKQGYTVKLSGG
ncbi:MAG TPA: stress response translation initiation inhibitor YciH [Spongiibacteraceae bacterium]|nr:stress response translation initiation inhibitor YciH [Spongiibacteraceae bacterium]